MAESNEEIVKRWRELIVKPAVKQEAEKRDDAAVSEDTGPEWEDYDFAGVWMGFVLGAGRPDLANYESYMNLGFPVEMEYE